MTPITISNHILIVFCVALKYICLYDATPVSYVPVIEFFCFVLKKMKKRKFVIYKFRICTFKYGVPTGT